ncbi:GroES-like protein [Schizophyllum commune H4-8]|uniref:Enoyl reductase (ER) domain-containing protein n=1 Tax=Schizophyllum commune (strain H4-8 / FGSC 9210) TaxID=578458 RepID=D8Q136_SCHCM|nr:GroES-like protein [Schizophyllum commune H4-8]KAI5895255.1 GroES-like protein [Schizophyllum commune H4-8]
MAAPRTIPQTQTAVLVGWTERKLTTVPVGKPGAGEVLIENVAVASNPKDVKIPKILYQEGESYVEGNDVAGTIVAVGEGVSEYEIGARVAAFTKVGTKDNKYGAYQQYTVGTLTTTFPVPNVVSYEEAATLPLALATAFIGLFVRLGIPAPDTPEAASNAGKAIIIHSAASSVGSYVVQLAKRTGLFVIATAGTSKDYARELGADVVIDYRDHQGETLVDALASAAGNRPTPWVYDAYSEKGSPLLLARVLEKVAKNNSVSNFKGKVTTVLPVPDEEHEQFPSSVEWERTFAGTVFNTDADFAGPFYRKVSTWLANKSCKANRCKIIPGGLAGVAKGLELLAKGVHGEKLVYQIADTPGIGA